MVAFDSNSKTSVVKAAHNLQHLDSMELKSDSVFQYPDQQPAANVNFNTL